MSIDHLPDPEAGRQVGNPSFAHGLVIGKFYPPHAGHDFLVRSAATFSRLATVLVLGSSVESLSIDERVAWLRATHAHRGNVRVAGALDDVRIDYADDQVWDAHLSIVEHALRHLDGDGRGTPAGAVDAVFTSEPYGAELARRLGAADVRLDEARDLMPVSGTAVRQDTVGRFAELAPAVRAGLARRVVVVGAESTGTTTLARDLAGALRARGGPFAGTRWVPEYGREYSMAKLAAARGAAVLAGAAPPDLGDLRWETAEFEAIAAEQVAWEDEAARAGGQVVVCDTDAVATLVWHERYVGPPSDALRRTAAAMPRRALYLLTGDAGVPFDDDGLRDGEQLRAAMTARFRSVLATCGVPAVEVAGDRQERLQCALQAVDELLAGWTFTPPLG